MFAAGQWRDGAAVPARRACARAGVDGPAIIAEDLAHDRGRAGLAGAR